MDVRAKSAWTYVHRTFERAWMGMNETCVKSIDSEQFLNGNEWDTEMKWTSPFDSYLDVVFSKWNRFFKNICKQMLGGKLTVDDWWVETLRHACGGDKRNNHPSLYSRHLHKQVASGFQFLLIFLGNSIWAFGEFRMKRHADDSVAIPEIPSPCLICGRWRRHISSKENPSHDSTLLSIKWCCQYWSSRLRLFSTYLK